MRIIRQPWGLALLLAASLIGSGGIARAETRPVVRLDSQVKDGVVRLLAQSTAPFQYTTSRPNRSLFVLDLTGVSGSRTLEWFNPSTGETAAGGTMTEFPFI